MQKTPTLNIIAYSHRPPKACRGRCNEMAPENVKTPPYSFLLCRNLIPKGIIIQAKDYVGKILKFELKNTSIAIATASIFNDKI